MNQIPYHLGIILDGNRRWAKKRGLPTLEGHRKGFEKVKEVVRWCKEKGIKVLTLYVFSTENWNRTKKEVDYLMRLISRAFKNESKEFSKLGVRVKVIGERKRPSQSILKEIEKIEKRTEKNKKMVLNFAFSYGGRAEIVQAVKKIVQKKTPLNKITEDLISKNLQAPDLDLVIRTGKVKRISNFLIWQLSYSEFYFLNKYWPDFSEKDLDRILEDFTKRKRRFGK